MREEIVRSKRRDNAEKARKAQEKNPALLAKKEKMGAENLAKWREENKKAVKTNAKKASKARTAETFARQSETIKNTIRRKSIRFAELMLKAKNSGKEITPQLETELMDKARLMVKEELKQERKAAKKASKS
jgi:hypothetical protein